VPTAADAYPGGAVTVLEKPMANPKSMSRLSKYFEPEDSQRPLALCRCDIGRPRGRGESSRALR